MKPKYLSLLFLVFLLLSCSKEEIENPLDWNFGKNEYNIEINGDVRNFIISVPADYDENNPTPMVFMLHGSTGTGTKFYNISRWAEKGEVENIITVFPTALKYPLTNGNNSTKWSSNGLINDVVPGTEIKDDIPFIEELVNLCKETFNIDESRVYISGFSNGGGFVKSQVVPRLGHVFAAASTAGGAGIPVPEDIEGDRIMPLYNIVGTQDNKIKEAIGVNEELPIEAGDIENHSFLWTQISTMCGMLGLDTQYTEEQHIPDYNLLTFDTKIDNDASEYVLMMVKDLGHNYPNNVNNPREVIAVDHIWPWYLKFQL